MTHSTRIAALALAICGAISPLQVAAQTAPGGQPVPQEPPPAAGATPADGLADLDAMTFSCPKAALNAAAREASRVPSQGTYQFAYFRIANDSHHAAYEVHFTSNYPGEAELKYCVALYCQQGWDPKTAKASVTLMDRTPQPKGMASHAAACAARPSPAKRPVRR
jgi:hypothetical protein